jgi:hypothetical protein
VLRVQTNRYVEAFLFAGASCIIAAILILTIKPRASVRNDASDLSLATT